MKSITERARDLTGVYALTPADRRDPEDFAYMVGRLAGEYSLEDDLARDHLHMAIEWNESQFMGDYTAQDVREVD